jgi:hypothetical protein
MKLLRGEVELRGQEQRNMEKYVVLAIAAIFAFVFGKDHDVKAPGFDRVTEYAWFVPPVLAAFAYYRWFERVKMIERLAEYIAAIEREFLKGQTVPRGWENFLIEKRKGGIMPQPYILLWIVLLPGSLLLGTFFSPLTKDNPGIAIVLYGIAGLLAIGISQHLSYLAERSGATPPTPLSGQ